MIEQQAHGEPSLTSPTATRQEIADALCRLQAAGAKAIYIRALRAKFNLQESQHGDQDPAGRG